MIKVLLLLAHLAAAEKTTQPCWHAREIYPGIAAHAMASSMEQRGDDCTIIWKPSPAHPVTYRDMAAERAASQEEMRALERNLDTNGFLTPAELWRLLKLLMFWVRASRGA